MKQALWFSTYYGEYISDESTFYGAPEILLVEYLEQNYKQISDELKVLWDKTQDDTMDKYGNYTAYDDVQFPPGGWKKLVFKTWGLNNKFMWQKFPVTASIIPKFPDIISCFVMKLGKNTTLRLHHGETNAIFRVHLGLKIPDCGIDSCGFEVNGRKIKWDNGKAFGFIDAHSHRAWNNSNEDRYVLLVDVIRPEFKSKRNYVCSKVIFSQILAGVGRKFKVDSLFKKGLPLGGFVFALLYGPIWLGTKINNTFGVLRF